MFRDHERLRTSTRGTPLQPDVWLSPIFELLTSQAAEAELISSCFALLLPSATRRSSLSKLCSRFGGQGGETSPHSGHRAGIYNTSALSPKSGHMHRKQLGHQPSGTSRAPAGWRRGPREAGPEPRGPRVLAPHEGAQPGCGRPCTSLGPCAGPCPPRAAQGQQQMLRLRRQSDPQLLLKASACQGGGAAPARAGQRDQREPPRRVLAGAQSLPSHPPGPLLCWWLLAGHKASALSRVSKASHQGRWEPDPDRDGKDYPWKRDR